MISKEKIESKIEELLKQREQMVAQVNACNGAIQILEQLIKEEEIVEEDNNG